MSNAMRSIAIPLALASATLLAGCAQTDPYKREGVWRPGTANQTNLAAMVANPSDLVRGRGDPNPGIRTATVPVARMWQGPQVQRPSGGAGGQQGQGEMAPRQPQGETNR